DAWTSDGTVSRKWQVISLRSAWTGTAGPFSGAGGVGLQDSDRYARRRNMGRKHASDPSALSGYGGASTNGRQSRGRSGEVLPCPQVADRTSRREAWSHQPTAGCAQKSGGLAFAGRKRQP